jgi:hypothetical protein
MWGLTGNLRDVIRKRHRLAVLLNKMKVTFLPYISVVH